MKGFIAAAMIVAMIYSIAYAQESAQTPRTDDKNTAEQATSVVSANTPTQKGAVAPQQNASPALVEEKPQSAPSSTVTPKTGFLPQTHLEAAVVTATRTERKTDEIPAGVSVVSKEDIKNTRMFGIKEALTGIAGVQAETKNGGYDARLIIRGAGLKARYGIREIMILLDGVPVTDPDGMSRIDMVDTQLVERIDVLKGPNSTLYGANAAGGVVNIITKSPYEEMAGIKAGYGSNDTQLYNAVYGNKVGNTYYLISGSRRSTDSWRKWNEFSTTQGNLKVGHLIDEKTTVEASVNYSEADIQLPGSLTKAQFDQDPAQLTSEPWRNSGRYSHSLLTSVTLKKSMDNVEFKPMVYYQWWQHYHPVTGLINDGGAEVFGADIQTDVKHGFGSTRGILTAGVSAQRDKAHGKQFAYRDVATNASGRIVSTSSDAAGALAEDGRDSTTKFGVYLQESIRTPERWIVDLGVRYDTIGFDVKAQEYLAYNYSTGRYASSTDSIDQTRTFNATSPRFGVVYKANNTTHLYGNVSTGFQTPQQSELSVNAGLKPAKTINYETGAKARFAGGHSIDLALFSIEVRDEIVQTVEPGNITSYSNAGKTRKQGVELTARAQVVEHAFLGGSYTYSDFRFMNFAEPVRQGANYVYLERGGKHLPYIPTNQYSVFGLYHHPSGFKVKLDASTWDEYYVDNANSEKYKGYELVTNGLIGYETKHVDIVLDVYNMFDNKYAMEVTKDTGSSLSYKPGAPRTWMARVSYNF
jgi:iron complex outermembrane recepter protein